MEYLIERIYYDCKKNATSKYIGVSYDKSQGKWKININKNKKSIFRKFHTNDEYIARERDLYILDNLKNDKYKLNFEWTPEEIIKWKNELQC